MLRVKRPHPSRRAFGAPQDEDIFEPCLRGLTQSSVQPHPEEHSEAVRLEGWGWPVSGAYLYILLCADGSYYVGTCRKALDMRVAEHNAGLFGGYTSTRRPVILVYACHFEAITDAIAAERQIKGWSRAKKQALVQGDWGLVSALAQRRRPHSSRRAPAARSSG